MLQRLFKRASILTFYCLFTNAKERAEWLVTTYTTYQRPLSIRKAGLRGMDALVVQVARKYKAELITFDQEMLLKAAM